MHLKLPSCVNGEFQIVSKSEVSSGHGAKSEFQRTVRTSVPFGSLTSLREHNVRTVTFMTGHSTR